MRLRHALLSASLLVVGVTEGAWGQSGDLRLFGYFQNTFQHQTDIPHQPEQNSFGLQQLNLFLQKNLAPRWTSFVNVEIVNSYSSARSWGALNLEEAWVNYRLSKHLQLKLGLHIPPFNHLNTIKNRTPLLPYANRPLIYESSFSEVIDIEAHLPARAFVQVSGFLPFGGAKMDYAAYLGNSPNINDRADEGITGADTTATLLVGGRLGLRMEELDLGLRMEEVKAGFSATYDQTNRFLGADEFFQLPPTNLKEMPRLRWGVDFKTRIGNAYIEAESARVEYDDGTVHLRIDQDFYYFTLGYFLRDEFQVFAGYWDTKETFAPFEIGDVDVPNAGFKFDLNERVSLKGHYAWVEIEEFSLAVGADGAWDTPMEETNGFSFISLAISAIF
ncbi:MAG: hypothetical protein GKR89_32860 [Candidatus Latescibacteria bacterium]|nr:hypothetical protein [Candidatus Latescibacterota bacterium]